MSPTRLLAAAAALALSIPFAAPARADGIEVHDAYLVATRPGATTAAAYMVIHNHSGSDDRLLSAASPAARRVTLHTSAEENGVVRMTPVEEGLPLPQDGAIVLDPGGFHLMLTGIAQPLADGDVVPLTLDFEVAGPVEVEVPVQLGRLGGGSMGAMDHMDAMEPMGQSGG